MLTTLATLFALLFGFTGSAVPTIEAIPTSASIQHVEEDEAGWDCTTMGNKVCGPTADAADVLWPAVDNRFAAMTQCHYFLDAGTDRDDCLSSAQDAFPPLAACMEEDSAGPCYWSATTRGNGSGEAFTVDADGVVTLISAALR